MIDESLNYVIEKNSSTFKIEKIIFFKNEKKNPMPKIVKFFVSKTLTDKIVTH